MKEDRVMNRILVIDDDEGILRIVKKALTREGYEVILGRGIEEIKEETLYTCQLILLDVMMPGTDGFTWCKRIRDQVDCPILFLTAKTEEKDLMEGLGCGGDDYITKPFGLDELRARVAAHLRRESREKKHLLTIGEVQFSLQAKKVYIRGRELPLTKSEYAICEYLAINRGQVFSKERIYEYVFGFDGESDSAAITEHVKNIRSKCRKENADPIETVWGIGYRWR